MIKMCHVHVAKESVKMFLEVTVIWEADIGNFNSDQPKSKTHLRCRQSRITSVFCFQRRLCH